MPLEAQDNPFTSVLFVGAADPEALPDADPSAGSFRLAIDDTGAAHIVDSTGSATAVGGSSIADIIDIPTAETDDTLVLAPDGAGGVEFRAEAGGGGGVTAAQNQLSADVTLAAVSTFYDTVSLSCVAGTYIFMATLIVTGNVSSVYGKLWDGTTVFSTSGVTIPNNGYRTIVTFMSYQVLSTTKTVKVSMAENSSAAPVVKAASPDGSMGNFGSTLVAIKIA